MRNLYFMLFFLVPVAVTAQMQFNWLAAAGGAEQDIVTSVAVDAWGNIFMAGEFEDVVDMDPGSGTALFTSVASSDGFIIKLDSSGQFLWAAQLGNTSSGNVKGIAVDAAGNCYATGIFRGTIDLDPGAGTASFTTVQYDDIFIVSLDPQGNYRWGKHIGTTGGDFAWSVCSDPAGNVTVLGDFMNTMDFDPGSGVSNLTSNGQGDMFLLHLDSMGNYIWAVNVGGDNDESPKTVKADASGNIYATGYFRDTVDFDPGAAVSQHIAAGTEDVFVLKFTSGGTLAWSKTVGGPAGDDGKSIAVDNNGNVFVCGYFNNTVDFDPGPGIASMTANQRDGYILKLDASGNYIWAQKISGNNNDNAYEVTVNTSGDVYVAGIFSGGLDLDPGPASHSVFEAGTGDTYIIRFDANGNFLWGGAVGGSGFDYSGGMVAGNGYVVIGITFELTADLDPNSGVQNVTSSGDTDVSMIKISDSPTAIGENKHSYVNVYPNPFTDHIYIQTDNLSSGLFDIYDAAGRYVISDKLNEKQSIDLTSLDAGIYFLRFQATFGTSEMKLIKTGN